MTLAASHDRTPLPCPGVSAAVFRGRRVLLVERAKPPLLGFWSLPGGRVEPGETVRAAAVRELREETGIEADLMGIADVVDVMLRDATGALRKQYVLTVFYGIWRAGEPRAASDCAQARWVEPDQLPRFRLTQGAASVIAKAQRLVATSAGGRSGLREDP